MNVLIQNLCIMIGLLGKTSSIEVVSTRSSIYTIWW